MLTESYVPDSPDDHEDEEGVADCSQSDNNTNWVHVEYEQYEKDPWKRQPQGPEYQDRHIVSSNRLES